MKAATRLTIGAALLMSPALVGAGPAHALDCEDDQVAAVYAEVCVEETPVPDGPGGSGPDGAGGSGPGGPGGSGPDGTGGSGPGGPGTPVSGQNGGPGSGQTGGPGSGETGGPGSGEIGGPGSGENGTNSAGGDAPPAQLPFTGAEVVLLSALGTGAAVAGTLLVVAGRRRRPAV